MAMLRASPAHGARPTSHPLVRASTSTSSPWRRIASMLSIPSITRCKSNDRSLSLHHPLPRCCLSLRDSCKPYLAMPRDYEEVLRCLSSLITQRTRGDGANRGDQFDLMFDYLKILDLEDAISQLKVIHVAGTKGKGSTCTFTESILRSCGFRTGLFTSPHLIDIRERFRLDGVEICEDKFLDNFWWCWNRLKEKTGDHLQMPSYFRFLTLLAFKIFLAEQLFLIREQLFKAQTADVIGKFLLMVKLQNTIMKLISRCKVEVAIMEVGLGGKYDATNVVREPIVCGITSLGYDHMEILGNTLGKIAGEKAGIFKKGVPAYTAPQPEEAMKVLVDKASQLSISLQVVSPLDPGQLGTQHLGLHGEHQYINASLAIALSSTWLNTTGNSKDINLDQDNLPEQFIRGLSRASLEGRAQIVPDSFAQQLNSNIGDLTFYLDGAHSPESLEMCAKWFSHVIRVDSLNLEKQSIKNNYIRKGGHPNSPGGKEHLHILLFNCMSVRDPQLLLPRLVNTCAHLGVKFHKAIFVPNQSVYNKVSSDAAAPPADAHQSDLSWQLTLQRVWQNVVRSEQDPGDISEYDGSLIFPSLPLAIKWLRESALQNRSTQFQVLVTGSLHLVGDVLRLIRK